jgi:catechol 2,3-dioxygenase-like lactoylglutathione lyase family enzyme
MPDLNIEGLDHIAIVVRDLKASTEWYERVLGLERKFADVWGDVPVMLAARGEGRSGVALFPISVEKPQPLPARRSSLAVDHVAFRVDRENFERARGRLRELGISFEFEDHTVSHSIYFDDPDGNRLEITTYEVR